MLVLPLKLPLSPIDDAARSPLVLPLLLLSVFMLGRSNRLLDHMGVPVTTTDEEDEPDTGRPPDDDTGDIPAIVC